MIRPKCGASQRPGFARCADCLVDLVESCTEPETAAPPEPGPPLIEPVCVQRVMRRGLLPLAESALRSAGIPFAVVGEQTQQLTGLALLGAATLYVSAADADDARALLGDLDA